jgi:hypothetical protein
MTRKGPKKERARSATAGSWIALVAATTLGAAAGAVRAEVRATGLSEKGTYRLVVQSYDADGAQVPNRYARPVGSLQRSVTADELRHGVHVSLVEFRGHTGTVNGEGEPMLVAWVEAGEPDLEFDGRTARPRPGSVYGVVRRGSDDVVQISLNRKLAA